MPHLNVRWVSKDWSRHPEWRGRHDFYDTRPPLEEARIVDSLQDQDWPHGRPPSLICTPTVGYFQYTTYASLWPKQRCYFTTFYFTGDDGQTLSVNRGDLRGAFDQLVSEWEKIVVLQQKLRGLIDQFPTWSLIPDRVRDCHMQLEIPRAAAFNLAYRFSSVLDRLADAEATGDAPLAWMPFGSLDLSSVSAALTQTCSLASTESSDLISTFAFQVAYEMRRNGGALPHDPQLESLTEQSENEYQKLLYDFTRAHMFLSPTGPDKYTPVGPAARAHVQAVTEAAKWKMEPVTKS